MEAIPGDTPFCTITHMSNLEYAAQKLFFTSLPCSPSYMKVLIPQSRPTLCNLMDCGLPGSSVHGDSPGKNSGVGCHALLQGIFPTQGFNPGLQHCKQIVYCLSPQGSPRILEWVACPFSILPMSPPLLYRYHIPCGTLVKAAWWASFNPVSVAPSDFM